MIVEQFVEGQIANNNYLLIDEETSEAALIDCSDIIAELPVKLKQYDAKLKYILLTHGHFDHLLGVVATKKLYPDIKIYMHIGDKELVDNSDEFMRSVDMEPFEHPHIDKYLEGGEEIEIGKTKLKVIHLPGHTQGGVGYLVDNMLFSGDTVFLESIGRTDLPGGNHEQLVQTVKDKIFTLDDNTMIYVGHGMSTTVEHENKYNDYV